MRICRASTINFFLLGTQRNLYFLSEYLITSHSKTCRDSVFRIELTVDPQVRQSLTIVQSGCIKI